MRCCPCWGFLSIAFRPSEESSSPVRRPRLSIDDEKWSSHALVDWLQSRWSPSLSKEIGHMARQSYISSDLQANMRRELREQTAQFLQSARNVEHLPLIRFAGYKHGS